MLIFLYIIIGLGVCLFVAFAFSLIKSSRKADEGEEKILNIISPSMNNSEKFENTIKHKHHEKVHV